MHRRERKRIFSAAAGLLMTAVFVVLLIGIVGANPSAVVSFIALVFIGWFVSQQAFRRADEREAREQAEGPQRLDTATKTVPPRADRPRRDRSALIPLEPEAVLRELWALASFAGEMVSTSLWMEDLPTATLRVIASVGSMPGGDTPLSSTEGSAGDALASASPVFAPVADVSEDRDGRRVWRLALPMDAGGTRGLAIVDLVPDDHPDTEDLYLATVPLAGTLVATLALFVARQETETARDLIDAVTRLARCADPDAVLDCALDHAMAMSSAATGSIMLLDADGRLSIVRSHGLPQEVVDGTRIARGEGIAGWVLSTGRPLVVEDLPTREIRSHRRGIRSTVSVPLADEQGTLGVLNIGSRVFPARFTRRHMEAMETFGCQVSVAYRNALAVGATRDLYLSTLKTLAIAIKKRDPSATDCTDRVLDMVVALGRAMRLGEDEMMTLEIAALFHDLGMVAAGSSLARDDRPLTTLEHGLLKMHPVIAAEVISEAPALREVAPIVYHHHERFDGLGYVGGLAGEDIPVGARVLSVVDAYVAMTSPRAYRSALTRMQAVDELRKNAGSQFDPEVVERFVEILFTEGARAHDAAGS